VIAGENLPVQLAARVLHVLKSGYYRWKKHTAPARSPRHAFLTEIIGAVHTASRGVHGARRVHAELTLARGIVVSHGTVELLMGRAGLKGLPGNDSRRPKPEVPTASDLVKRAFARDARDHLWVTDITEHPTREGKVYCAVVLDTFSRRVVGWSINASQTSAPVTNALSMAISNRTPDRRAFWRLIASEVTTVEAADGVGVHGPSGRGGSVTLARCGIALAASRQRLVA